MVPDIPIIMGISPFKSRFDLLLEKAELKENDFKGNEYTEYGNVMEPKIRDYINKSEKDKYIEDKIIQDDLRYHSDGFNGKSVLEIKTTSQIKGDVEDYKIYLVQLLMGMQMHGVKKGKLAVYKRPDDFNEDFNENNLKIYDIDIKDYKYLLDELNLAIWQFRNDLEKVKKNPLITEEELQPKELIKIANEVEKLENQLSTFKELEKKHKKLKDSLKKTMEEHGVKKWTTNAGTQITLVADGEDKEVEVKKVDTEKFEKENKDLITDFTELQEKYNKALEKYTTTETEIKKGRKGYVKITLSE